MSPISKTFVSFTVVAVFSSPAIAQGLVTEKNIPLALAQTIANAALAQCQSMGFKVAVTVVDRGGLPIVMLRGDGAGLHTPEGSERKAYTAHVRPVFGGGCQTDARRSDLGRVAAIHPRAGAVRRAADQGRRSGCGRGRTRSARAMSWRE
jgi:hypothetical protein